MQMPFFEPGDYVVLGLMLNAYSSLIPLLETASLIMGTLFIAVRTIVIIREHFRKPKPCKACEKPNRYSP